MSAHHPKTALAILLYRTAWRVDSAISAIEDAVKSNVLQLPLEPCAETKEIDEIYAHAELISAALRSAAMRIDRGAMHWTDIEETAAGKAVRG